jgi:hypothetical protein
LCGRSRDLLPHGPNRPRPEIRNERPSRRGRRDRQAEGTTQERALSVDFSLLTSIAEKIGLLFAGGLVGRFFERRARVVVFYGHVGQFRQQPQQQQPGPVQQQPSPGPVHTHSVVIRNAGRVAAHNVHVPHRGMLNAANIHISIDPHLAHTVQGLPNGTEEILFPALPARFQVTISYLYFPPILFSQINAPIYSDEGPARVINVLPQERWPRWLSAVLGGLVLIGIIAVAYALFELVRLVRQT